MSEPPILKVSVLATNEILLNGQHVTLTELERAMRLGARQKAIVWYHRENAAGSPPTNAVEVMKLVVANKLPVRLSSKPDFSDAVQPSANLEQRAAAIRGKAGQRKLVILRPDGQQMMLPAMEREAAPAKALEVVERLLPSTTKRNVAVIADTAWTMTSSPNLQTANQAIPFFGMLMGFASIGHAVWIFGPAGIHLMGPFCRDADLLIVDGAHVAALPDGWQSGVRSSMRSSQILVFDRATQQLRKVQL